MLDVEVEQVSVASPRHRREEGAGSEERAHHHAAATTRQSKAQRGVHGQQVHLDVSDQSALAADQS